MILKKIFKALKILFNEGPNGLIEKIKENYYLKKYHFSINHEYQIWLKKNYPDENQLKKQKKEINNFKLKPLISIITPVYNPEKKHLIECIESVINQSYENWELCLIDDNSSKSYVKDILNNYAKKDKRIKIKFRQKNGHICIASNDALKMAKGEYIALLDHDDFLWPNALYEVVKLINKKPHTQFIYSDEDKLDYDGKTHVDPFFKPDWSPDYLRSINYITHFAVLKKSLIDKIGGFRAGTEGAQDWDLFLRATYWLEKNIGHCHSLDYKNPIQHIPKVFYSWRKTHYSTSSEKNVGKVKNYAYKNQVKVLNDYLKILKLNQKLLAYQSKFLGLIRIKIKSKKILDQLKNSVFFNKTSKNINFDLNHIIPILLINPRSIILPLKVKKHIVYDPEDNFLFFKHSPQPFPHLLKKESNFNIIPSNYLKQKIINNKISFITLKDNIIKNKKELNQFNFVVSPFLIDYNI